MSQIKIIRKLPSLLSLKSPKLKLLPIKRRTRFNSYIQGENQINSVSTSLINEDSVKNTKFNKINLNCGDFHQEICNSCKKQILSENKISQKRFSCDALPKVEHINSNIKKKSIKIGESPFKIRKIMRRLSNRKQKDNESIQKIVNENYFSIRLNHKKKSNNIDIYNNNNPLKKKITYLFQFQSPIMQINKSSSISNILTNQSYIQSIFNSNLSKFEKIKQSTMYNKQCK